MQYNKILRQIAENENISVQEVEREMKMAIAAAGWNCSVEEFIEKAALLAKTRLYIV